jgi:hypothetical protein
MLKIPIGDLEELRQNPIAYKTKLESGAPRYGGPSYFQTLRNAIFEFHKSNNTNIGFSYLEEHLEGFKSIRRCQQVMDDFQWYISEVQKTNWPTFRIKLNIKVPLSTRFADSLMVSGQISKVDINVSGGYGAWLLSNKKHEAWREELQMPIIQNAIAVELNTISSKVSIGIYNFVDHFSDYYTFQENEIRQAHRELEVALLQMGL